MHNHAAAQGTWVRKSHSFTLVLSKPESVKTHYDDWRLLSGMPTAAHQQLCSLSQSTVCHRNRWQCLSKKRQNNNEAVNSIPRM